MEKKEKYIAPTIEWVEVKVERGYACSSCGMIQKTEHLGNWSENHNDPDPWHVSFGSYGSNNDDWD